MVRIADVVRSLAFYALFYGGTVLLLVVATLVLVLRPSAFLAVADGWSAWHRGCVRHILGIGIELQGKLPEGRFFVAVKHESFFEAIDAPQFIARPAVFAKAELMRLPLWGRLARSYGLIGVERDRGAKALREMIAAAKQLAAEGRTLAIYPEGTRVPHATRAPLQAGFRRNLQIARSAGGAGRREQRAALSPGVEAQGNPHHPHRRADSPRLAARRGGETGA